MIKKLSALLLSLVLCLGLIGTAFAEGESEDFTVDAQTTKVVIESDTLTPGNYPLCSIANSNDEPLTAFNITKADFEGNHLKKEIPISLGNNVTVKVTVRDHGYVTDTTPSGGGGGGGGSAVTHRIEVAPVQNGTIKVSPTTAAKGEKVTITATPNEGYELSSLKATDANKAELELTKVDDTTCTFLMADSTVTVTGAFTKIGGVSFSDVPSSHTFYADIMWAAEKGYMNGYTDGTFRPDRNTTRQALWMVLARIDGANPSDMSAARAWAMSSNVSDGTRPEEAMSRQQMVTMLYRYAQQKGYNIGGGVDISAYPDADSVAAYAKDAMSWAVGNGIVNGTSDGRLNPEGTALRSHFAAFLHRYANIAGL